MKIVFKAFMCLFWAFFLLMFINKICGFMMKTAAGPWLIIGALIVAGIFALLDLK